MNLPEFANRNRVVIIFLTMLLMAWGVVSYLTMPRREDPEFTIRICVVSTRWPGVSAEKVEELVTYPLEEAIDGIEEVDFVRSTTTVGLSTVFVELDDRVPPAEIETVWGKVRAEVDKVEMPDPGVNPVVNSNFGDTSILLLAVYQVPVAGQIAIPDDYRYSFRQLEIYADQIKDALRLIDGVSDVTTFGTREESIYVQTDIGNWSQLDLTIDSLQTLISSRNITSDGGSVDTPAGRVSLQPGGLLDRVNELNSIVVGLAASGETANQVYLKDIGLEVLRDYEDPPERICRFGDADESRTAIMVGVTMRSGANIVTVCNLAKDRVDRLINVQRVLPGDIAVTPVSDLSENVDGRIQNVIGNVVSAIIIVVVVVYLLVGFRSASVMAANIPVVILGALAIVTLFGVQLEQISLASVIIALGLLVDNAVQVCDQSRTNQMQGMKPTEATISGAKTLAIPMLTGTVTTIAAFLPMLFMLTGGAREYVYSLPVTVSITLALSWIVAMTFCVLLAAAFIRVPRDGRSSLAPLPWLGSRLSALTSRLRRSRSEKQKSGKSEPDQLRTGEKGSAENVFLRLYGRLCRGALRLKFLTIAIAFGLLVLVAQLPIGSEFFPQDWRDQFVVEVWLPESATIAQTDAQARRVEELIRKLSPTTDPQGQPAQRIRAMRTIVGGGGARWHLAWSPESTKPNYAEILIRASDGRLTAEFADEIRRVAEQGDTTLGIEPIVAARVVPREMALGPPAIPVEIRLVGDGFANKSVLRTMADRLTRIVSAQPETWNVFDTWGASGLQLNVEVDEDKASLAGVSNSQIARTLSAYYSGQLLTTFREGEHSIPVYFRIKPEERRSLRQISRGYVEGSSGKLPLDSIASLKMDWQPARIERREMNRVIEVRSEVVRGASGNDVVNRIMDSPELKQLEQDLPPGFRLQVGGSLADSQDASQEFLMSFGISFLLIVMILVMQYNSISKPLVIIATLPLALIGALPGLYFSDNPLGFMPQLGIISLFGIVLNTGIIFIEFADILIAKKLREKTVADGPIMGLTRGEFRGCLVQAGKQRMLPIFLTTATTVGGLLPLALSGGPLWTGMAWCMISGLSVATLLTLLVVPALYAVFVENFRVRPVKLSESGQPGSS